MLSFMCVQRASLCFAPFCSCVKSITWICTLHAYFGSWKSGGRFTPMVHLALDRPHLGQQPQAAHSSPGLPTADPQEAGTSTRAWHILTPLPLALRPRCPPRGGRAAPPRWEPGTPESPQGIPPTCPAGWGLRAQLLSLEAEETPHRGAWAAGQVDIQGVSQADQEVKLLLIQPLLGALLAPEGESRPLLVGVASPGPCWLRPRTLSPASHCQAAGTRQSGSRNASSKAGRKDAFKGLASPQGAEHRLEPHGAGAGQGRGRGGATPRSHAQTPLGGAGIQQAGAGREDHCGLSPQPDSWAGCS